jgi:hypothetical protein
MSCSDSAAGLMTVELWSDVRQGQQIFVFITASRPALGPTGGVGALLQELSGKGVSFATYLLLVPRQKQKKNS